MSRAGAAMFLTLFRVTARAVRPQLPRPGGWALVGTARQLPHGVASGTLAVRAYWTRSAAVWRWVCEGVRSGVGAPRGKRPSGRVLMCGAVAFLWDRERIGNEEVTRCLKEYDDRVKSQLHTTLEQPAPLSSPPAPGTDSDSDTDERRLSHFRQELHALLQQNSDTHMSQLPLVGLREAGPLTRISMRAWSALRAARVEVAGTLGEAKKHVAVGLGCTLNTFGEAGERDENIDDLSEPTLSVQTNAVTLEDIDIHVHVPLTAVETVNGTPESAVSEANPSVVSSESDSAYCADHSSGRKVTDWPLVGLKSPGPAYSLSLKIANFSWKLTEGETRMQRQASFLAYLGHTMCDVPSFPLPSPALPASGAALISDGLEGLSATHVKETVASAFRQARSLLTAFPRGMLTVFDSMLDHKAELDSAPDSEQGEEEEPGCGTWQATSSGLRPDQLNTSVGEHLSPRVSSTLDKDDSISTDSYLARVGWERFADAQNCTVYRKPYQATGLYMYKVIGRYCDISVQDFLDVQVEHNCRKDWDTYVQRLETVDVDRQTGSEVVHWVMRFPFPMSSREYLYVRRVWVNKSAAVLINRSVGHSAVPECRQYVRVQNYISEMVMQPHTTTEQEGFEFELTYFDNPQTNLPSSCVNWVATAAMPDFLAKVHAAALQRREASPGSGVADVSAF